jgi:hypothetical protein
VVSSFSNIEDDVLFIVCTAEGSPPLVPFSDSARVVYHNPPALPHKISHVLPFSLFGQAPQRPGTDPIITHEVRRDFAELFEGGFKINDDLLGEDTGSGGKFVGFFAAFVSEKKSRRRAHR